MTLTLGGITDTAGIPLTEADGMQTGTIRGTEAGGLGIRHTGTCISVTTGDGTIHSMTLGGDMVMAIGLDTGTAIGQDTGTATGLVTVLGIGLAIGLDTDMDTIRDITLDTILETAPVQDLTTAGMYTTARGPHRLHIMRAGATTLQATMRQEGPTQEA